MADRFEIKVPELGVITEEEMLKELGLEQILLTEAQNCLKEIKQLTEGGKQADGAALKAYSPNYAELRRAAGRSTRTNLTVTQEMLRSLNVESFKDGTIMGARIYFLGNHSENSSQILQRAASKGRARRKRLDRRNGVKPAKPARQAKSTKLAGVKLGNPAKSGRTGGRRSGGGSKQLSNAQLAEALMDKGFTGWFTLSIRQLARIQRGVTAGIDRLAKRIWTTKD